MLQSSTIQFLKALKKNNNKEWFDKNRKIYEQAKADYLNFVTILLNEIQGFDTSLMELQPKQCIFRLNRDVRFSKNKDPYKTNFGASFSKGAKKVQSAGYYFHLEPGENFVGGGLWMPMAPDLNKVRQEIDYCFKEFSSILKKPAFKSTYGDMDNSMKLVRPPKGFDVDNPALEYLKLKSFVVTRSIKDTELTDKQLVKNVVKDFKTIAPLVHFLNRAIE
ncbi:MAG: DUF2461 domain-containing protein [Arcobacteraceae bacterium]|jgi:uncharacterized protein (TIGR02453 family)